MSFDRSCLLLTAVVVLAVRLPAPAPARGSAAPAAASTATATSATAVGTVLPAAQLPRSELFTFHSDAFINLHHFLYRWGEVGPGSDAARPRDPRIVVSEDDRQRYEAMDDADRQAWDYAGDYYRERVVGRDLLFDEGLVALRDCLVMAGNFCDRVAERDDVNLDVLNEVMPVYRRIFWNRHNAENRRWIDDVVPRARRFETAIAPRLAAAYGATWPESRNRVDATVYANTVGGYTTADGHITISSANPGNQGWWALEMLFHEASHGDPLERPLHALIGRAFATIDAEPPADLWHMTIFYTAGHISRKVLEEAGVDYPQTYAEYAGIYARRDDSTRAKAALDRHWAAALDAGDGFEEAMAAVARTWQAAGR